MDMSDNLFTGQIPDFGTRPLEPRYVNIVNTKYAPLGIETRIGNSKLGFSNNRFTQLPDAVDPGTTHVYLSGNPIRSTAAELSSLIATMPDLLAFDVNFVFESPFLLEEPSMDCHRAGYGGGLNSCFLNDKILDPPESCTVGQPCSWTLQVYLGSAFPASCGGLIPDLAIGYDCTCDEICSYDARHGTFQMHDDDAGVARLGLPWLNSCAVYASIYGASASTGCDAAFIRASPSCVSLPTVLTRFLTQAYTVLVHAGCKLPK